MSKEALESPKTIRSTVGQAAPRQWLSRAIGGAIVIIGFILSPLSWWNDLLVNIPLAYLFAVPTAWVWPNLFMSAFIIGYLLTNVAGFLMMHHGMRQTLQDSKKKSFKKELKSGLVWSGLYTALIVTLVLTGLITPPAPPKF